MDLEKIVRGEELTVVLNLTKLQVATVFHVPDTHDFQHAQSKMMQSGGCNSALHR